MRILQDGLVINKDVKDEMSIQDQKDIKILNLEPER